MHKVLGADRFSYTSWPIIEMLQLSDVNIKREITKSICTTTNAHESGGHRENPFSTQVNHRYGPESLQRRRIEIRKPRDLENKLRARFITVWM